MIEEVKEIKSNAGIVKEGPLPTLPLLIFSSNGEGTGWDRETWKSYQKDYVGEIKNGEVIDLDSSHYVHDIEYEKIAHISEDFIENLR